MSFRGTFLPGGDIPGVNPRYMEGVSSPMRVLLFGTCLAVTFFPEAGEGADLRVAPCRSSPHRSPALPPSRLLL